MKLRFEIRDHLIRRGSLLPLSNLLPCNKNILASQVGHNNNSLSAFLFILGYFYTGDISIITAIQVVIFTKMKDSIKVTFLGPLASFSHQVCNFPHFIPSTKANQSIDFNRLPLIALARVILLLYSHPSHLPKHSPQFRITTPTML